MAKTGIDQGVTKVHNLNKYFAVWASKMSIGATPGQITALVNLTACIATFLQEWHKATPVN